MVVQLTKLITLVRHNGLAGVTYLVSLNMLAHLMMLGKMT